MCRDEVSFAQAYLQIWLSNKKVTSLFIEILLNGLPKICPIEMNRAKSTFFDMFATQSQRQRHLSGQMG
jgi:hypothetical protein